MAAKKLIPMAICYDFDGTLSPGNMQEYDFMQEINQTPKEFWAKVSNLTQKTGADNISIYMKLMISESKNNNKPFTHKTFTKYGKNIKLFKGVETWFDRINQYGKEKGVKVSHYIISSGIKEMIEGTKIGKKFTAIYASSFLYDSNEAAEWPAVVLNFTTKTRYLFEINKGRKHSLNEFVPDEKRTIPFANMIYIGDGETDVPCMRIVKKEGGHSIAVYPPVKRKKKQIAEKLLKDGRVNIIAMSDYSENSKIDLFIKAMIDKLALDYKIKNIIKSKDKETNEESFEQATCDEQKHIINKDNKNNEKLAD